jgi:hypothetical protein
MSYIISDIPVLLSVLVRREFTQNFNDGLGDLIPAHIVGVRCQEGHSLQFQIRFEDLDHGGAMFCLPLQALCWKECPEPPSDLLQPWDVFSEHFSCHEFKLLRNSRAWLLNVNNLVGYDARIESRYLFTIDFTGNALADCFEQHKQLHILQVSEGWFAAVPNNRMLSSDSAFSGVAVDLPRFQSLAANFCGEVDFHLPI